MSESWVLPASDGKALAVFERKVFRSTHDPIKNSEWRMRYNYELYALHKNIDTITFIKVSRLKWAGYVVRMDQQ
jgi:hypothetical protein